MSWDARLDRRIRWPVVSAVLPSAAGTAQAVEVVDAVVWETVGDWNMTHNCNGMIEAVLGDTVAETTKPWWSQFADEHGGFSSDPEEPHIGRWSWWDLLDGRSGAEGHFLLRRIVEGLEADPERFRAMNPTNGWGDYSSLLAVLREMRDACAVEDPDLVWAASG